MGHAAVRAIQYYPEIRDWYHRKKRRKKPEAVTRALVAKELAQIVYHVLRKREDFNGRFKGGDPEPRQARAVAGAHPWCAAPELDRHN